MEEILLLMKIAAQQVTPEQMFRRLVNYELFIVTCESVGLDPLLDTALSGYWRKSIISISAENRALVPLVSFCTLTLDLSLCPPAGNPERWR